MNPGIVVFLQYAFGALVIFAASCLVLAYFIKDVITHHHKTKAGIQIMLRDQEQGGSSWLRDMVQQVKEMNRDGQRKG